jgi:hypothetical protein
MNLETVSNHSAKTGRKTPEQKKITRRARNRRYRLKKKATGARQTVLKAVLAKTHNGSTVDAALAESLGDSLFAQEARNYRGIISAIVRRREQLGLSQLEVDELAGLQAGYCGKCEKPSTSYGRIMGELSFPILLQTLGLTLIVTEIGYARTAQDHVKVGERRRGAGKKKEKR